ncbi:MAG: glycosyltransferase family 39 protein [Terriglobales bacterium]
MPKELASRTGTSLQKLGWLTLLLLLAAFAMLVQGYHPGLEDDAFYLAAIKQDLNPSLFPHDADFFRVQFQATVFDKLIALSLRWTHVPLEWGILFWQGAVTVLILWGCWRISRRCFAEAHAQWAAVTLVAVLLTLPVSGTGLNLTDQHLHPRALATALILAAIVAVLDRRLVLAGALLAVAFSVHAIMAAFGASYCLFLMWKPAERTKTERTKTKVDQQRTAVLAALLWPLGWMFDPPSDAWRQAAATRSFYFVLRWHWYEWLGVVAPLLLLWWFRALARRRSQTVLAHVAERLVYFGGFQLAVALIILLPARLERLRPLEPMRFLHLVYLLFVLLAGGLLGQYVLKKHALRWLLLFVPLSAGMFYAQRQMYPATAHLELPGSLSRNEASRNNWVEAFRWISRNTPVDSQFALDPRYMELPGEDYHGFRAVAERSVLADELKDAGMAARVPRLAPRWLREVEAQRGWRDFQRPDFLRLKAEFGVDWVVLQAPGVEGLPCPYRNPQVVVCRVE